MEKIAMKRSKFTESQIVFALRQADTGVKVAEVCRKMGISEATFYNWKKKYGGLGVTELHRLRQLEEENSQLKKIVADLSLDKQMLQDILKGKTWCSSYWMITGSRFTGHVSWLCFKGRCGILGQRQEMTKP
jgi:putative transposase